MIKIYTDIAILSEQNLDDYLHPLITCLQDKNSILHEKFQVVENIALCDICVLPVALEQLFKLGKSNYVNNFFKEAKENLRHVYTFTSGDIGLSINDPNIYNLRLGGFDSKMNSRTSIMPPFIVDPYLFLDKEIGYLDKGKFPIIGFVGHSNGSLLKWIKELLIHLNSVAKLVLKKEYTDRQSFYPSSFFRNKYLLRLQKNSKNIKTDFIFRKNYRAGAKTKALRYKTSLEFYDNIYRNAYTFCMRGVGNWSVRFYETLAMGRIPVLIDTDNRLPFQDRIDWEKHCVIIKEREFHTIYDKLNVFHKSFSDKSFKDLQTSNRKLWEHYFTKEDFFSNMAKEIESRLNT